ncbi:MAG: hypothetical protein ACO1RT_09855 [Planctomycetaceae bacterium]
MQNFRRRLPSLLVLLLTLPAVTGCDGCRRTEDDGAEKAAGPQTTVDEFTFAGAVPLPAGGSLGNSAVKIGHWFSLRQSIRSNQVDQRGELTFRAAVNSSVGGATPLTRTTTGTGGDADGQGAGLVCQRPAVLPKGRMKRLDLRLLATADRISTPAKISTIGTFTSPSTSYSNGRIEHQAMLGSEYFFVVLTTRPERFASFQAADWVRAPLASDGDPSPPQFRLVFPRAGGVLSLPETMLDWTSTAFVFWDDVSPSELTTQQRRALTDWLNFGGRMIVNGDAVVSELANSELGPLLPIAFTGMQSLESEAAAALVEHWSVEGDGSQTSVSSLVRSQASGVALMGDPAGDAKGIEGTSDLLVARRVGRGEIVMSRFDLTADWWLGWRSRDSFFNAAALARPPRRYTVDRGNLIQSHVDNSAGATDLPRPLIGAAINSTLRLASRDAGLASATNNASPGPVDNVEPVAASEFVAHPYSGLGGWRDDSDVGKLLQSALREQSGVSIPPRSFVVRSLAIYLAILVPANYVVFLILGRLEWAWLAVPVLALVGAGWIARTVSLDLGLARNRSEVSLLELQPEYSRGHLTRYAAIYNSLSGSYQIQFETSDAAVAPVDLFGQGIGTPAIFRYGYSDGPMLDRFLVPSNRTRLFHAEQVVDVGGVVKLDGNRIRNASQLQLTDAIAVRKLADGTLQQATIGALDAGSTVAIRWTSASASDVDSLTSSLIQSDALPRESARLIARSAEALPGMTITPETPLQGMTTMVLAHLIHAPQTRWTGDVSLMPTKKERDQLLLDQEDPSAVQEIRVP